MNLTDHWKSDVFHLQLDGNRGLLMLTDGAISEDLAAAEGNIGGDRRNIVSRADPGLQP